MSTASIGAIYSDLSLVSRPTSGAFSPSGQIVATASSSPGTEFDSQSCTMSCNLPLYSDLSLLMQALVCPTLRSAPTLEAPMMKLPWIFVSIITASVIVEGSSPIHSVSLQLSPHLPTSLSSGGGMREER